MSFETVLGTLGTLSSLGVGGLLISSRKQLALLRQDVIDLRGRPARYGAAGGLIAPAVPGAMEQLADHGRTLAQHGEVLASLSAELQPNGGKSLHDRMVKQSDAIAEMRATLSAFTMTPTDPAL